MNTYLAHPELPRAELVYKQKTGLSQAELLFHYIHHTLPRVNKLLSRWKREAQQCIDNELRVQALNSIAGKDFHCQGGAVFAVPYPDSEDLLLRLIVAYQTLCDYLDNLCDRADCWDGRAFRELHQSLIDALTPGMDKHSYYHTYPYQNDGGYIDKMVDECRQCIEELPSYQLVHRDVIGLVGLYIELQVKKHIAWDLREQTLKDWAQANLSWNPGILWNEFAASAGSTLALFALLGLATRPDTNRCEIESMLQTYFPWICGLHILLDYFIDQDEDRTGGDLNFTFYYPDQEVMIDRFKTFIRESHRRASQLPNPGFEKMVIEGLLAMYFSDKKVRKQGFNQMARELINESGRGALHTYRICSVVRKFI
ncbi:MAG: tetraprenyl-beta-curcumene synthase family protein [Syntrophomonas sp.]|nr:tetraprenyl-beta-curcumene synthase family protein [Syntrophomonas sp.]